MQAVSRSAPRAACRKVQQRATSRQSIRRYADNHGNSNGHDANPNASFGPSFYLVVAAIPGSVLLYNFAQSSKDGSTNPITALIAKYSDYRDLWHERNALHFKVMEQAAFDRNLFHNTATLTYRELEYPEVFNRGGQINVMAGHKANLEEVIEKYRKQAFDEEEEKLQKMKAGELPGQEAYKEIPPTPPRK